MSYALGIDLGTTFTAAAVFEGGAGSPVDLGGRGDRLETPTAVFVEDDRSQWRFGVAALAAAEAEPGRLVTGFKRDIGRAQPLLVDGQSIAPAELMLALLEEVLGIVTAGQGSSPNHVTLTHPANWGLHRQGELRHIAEAAGLVAAGLLPEPDATAVFHAATRPVAPGSLFAVYDLGGGTFDVSLLRKTPDRFELIGPSHGIEDLGGLDFDDRLWSMVTDRVGQAWFSADDGSTEANQRALALEQAVTRGREELSDRETVDIEVPLADRSETVTITREEFEAAALGLVDRTIDLVARSCSANDVDPSQLSAVILTGGTSRTPLIARRLREELGVDVTSEPQPKYSVCLGAAVTAAAVSDLETPRPTLGPVERPQPTASDIVVAVDIERSGLGGSHDLDLQSVPLTGVVSPLRLRAMPDEPKPVAAPVTVVTGERRSNEGLFVAAAVAVIVAVIVLLLVLG